MAKLTDVRQSFGSSNWRSDERENTSWSLTTFSSTLARQAGLAFYSFYYLDTHRDPSPTDLLWKMISKQVLIRGQVLAAPCCASKWGKDCTPSTFAGSLSTVGTDTGLLELVGAEGALPLQILADQLTLSEPGGQIMPTIWLYAPPDFQTFRHPWTDRHLLKKLHLQMSQLTKHLSSTYQLVPTNVFINVEFWVCQALLIQFTNYRKFASSNTSRLEAHADFIRLLMNYLQL